MTFKNFKKICIEYFYSKSVVKKKYIKRALKFEYKPTFKNNLLEVYHVNFIYNNHCLCLTFWGDEWSLDETTIYGENKLCNFASTINLCCDYLWNFGGELKI